MNDQNVNTTSHGKSGGDAVGFGGAGAGAMGGDGMASSHAHSSGCAPDANAGALGAGGDTFASAGARGGASGGDVSDNTNIGEIDIS